jgi:alpha-L-fucosidase
MTTRRFEPTIASLLDYECPSWFRDAKFGVYLHWGPYSVAEYGEWYPRNMYIEGDSSYLHHIEHYGHPSEHGYKDMVPDWKAENWDPDGLVDLFKSAGARYFTPCAVHHDNFDLWNSKHHRWNSVRMGPKMDITGIWRKVALNAGLRFGVTTHAERTWSWLQTNKGADRSGPKAGVPYDGNDPEYRDFYLAPGTDANLAHPLNAPPAWCQHWMARIKDLIDNYHPDHLYFDGSIPFAGDDNGRSGMEIIAHLYNHSMEIHDGAQEAVMCIKNIANHGIYVEGVATLDLERTRADEIRPAAWQTDTSIGPWGYRAGAAYRSSKEILHELIDIVSKNGNMLLNVPPKADGTLDEGTHAVLKDIGAWLETNGDAIYGTRPWTTPGKDSIRFTRKGNAVYAIVLEVPEDTKVLRIAELGEKGGIGHVESIELLGCQSDIRWGQEKNNLDRSCLRVVLPDNLPDSPAYAFRVNFQ